MATPQELAAAGVPQAVIEKVTAGADKRAEALEAMQKTLTGWTPKTVWNRFDGTFPHVIPADAAAGLEKDLVLYENAVIFAGAPGAGQTNEQGVVPPGARDDQAGRHLEVRRAAPPRRPREAGRGLGQRHPRGDLRRRRARAPARRGDGSGPQGPGRLRQRQRASSRRGEKKEVAQFHYGRVPLLNAIVKVAKDPEDQLSYRKQIVDSLVAAYQTGAYPKARKVLDGIIDENTKLSSYAAYRSIGAEFVMRNEEPGGNFLANQKKWMAELEGFLNKFAKSDEAAEVWLQLGSSNEFNAEEDKAREDYTKLVESFPDTPSGKKAAGAFKRLDLVGKSVAIKGTSLQGETIDTAQSRGKSVLVVFWASWGGQSVRRELPDLVKLYDKFHAKGLEVVGVSLDNEKADLEAFLKEQPMSWPQIFEPGGIDSRLATEYGIISLPTMFLIDGQGKVVNRSLRTASEVERSSRSCSPRSSPAWPWAIAEPDQGFPTLRKNCPRVLLSPADWTPGRRRLLRGKEAVQGGRPVSRLAREPTTLRAVGSPKNVPSRFQSEGPQGLHPG